ncbi:hypothetical protein WH91_16180 [Devosia psychrophila]|uniref:Uncharacterized protein n=1 Tax=Devosia psychrophila TaxID=728005 RepID=A0ABR5DVJ8_9HYPH|nr:hypothetical protein WH91_16180 [Devosia psychrophila]
MTRMKVSVPFRHKNTRRHAKQFVGVVAQHGFDAIIGEDDPAGIVKHEYCIRTGLVKLAKRGLFYSRGFAVPVCNARSKTANLDRGPTFSNSHAEPPAIWPRKVNGCMLILAKN